MKKIIIVAILAIIILAIYFSRPKTPPLAPNVEAEKKSEMYINGKRIEIELAQTEELRTQGLSGREGLCSDCGMLFIFDQAGFHSFWMKDMRFDLDIIWLAGNKIVKITKNVPYIRGSRESIHPEMPIDKVLEINAGKSEELGLQVGEHIDIKL